MSGHAHRARKRFGQHFLEPAWVDKVVQAIAPKPDQTFLEIGPGRGELTRPLLMRAQHVVAFEIDRDLARALRATAPPNLTLIEGDFLDTTPARLRSLLAGASAIRIAGNLPYNVASPILFKLAELSEGDLPATDATLMLQREVADRLTASPGTRDYGLLTVLIGRRAAIEPVLLLPPGAFRPPPKVRSALVRFQFHPATPPVKDERLFAALVRSIFMHRRKTLKNALAACSATQKLARADMLALAQLDGRRRPETLTAEEMARLSGLLTLD